MQTPNARDVGPLTVLAAVIAVLSTFAPPCRAASGKLIATGWDSPNSAGFHQNAAEFEKWPFDGVTIFPTIKRLDGTTASNGYAFSCERWDPDACRDMIADLEAT